MDPLVMTLRAIQSTANNQGSPASLTWDAINRLTQQYGTPDIDFERFAARYDADPVLQSFVDNFDEHGIVLKTDAGGQEQPQQGGQAAPKDMMASTAMAATKRAQ